MGQYTQAQRATAAGIAAAEGVTAAERATGIPKTTIQYWVTKPEFAHLRTNARDVVADAFYVAIQIGLEQVLAGLQGDASLKDKAIALATVYDRYALLTGAATSRSESRDLTGSLSDADLAGAVREAVAITGGDRTPAAAAEPPEGEGL